MLPRKFGNYILHMAGITQNKQKCFILTVWLSALFECFQMLYLNQMVYELSGCGFESRCSHLCFIFIAVPQGRKKCNQIRSKWRKKLTLKNN